MKQDKQTQNTDLQQEQSAEQQTEQQEPQAEQPTEQATEEAVGQSTDPIEQLQKENAELRERCDELADQKLRLIAEFDNYRRRTAKEKIELQKTAGEGIFKDMLPLIDDFERALKAMQTTDDVEAVRSGVELIYQKFVGFLAGNDVTPIATDNEDFNTELHEAITTFPAPSEEQKGKVIECTQKGYKLGDKVIRYAKVVVGE